MFWILVAAGAVAGGIIGYLLSRRSEKPTTAGGCCSKEDDTESGCPLCSAGGVNVIGGGLIGAILVLLGGMAGGAVECPLTVCAPKPVTGQPAAEAPSVGDAAGITATPAAATAAASAMTGDSRATASANAQTPVSDSAPAAPATPAARTKPAASKPAPASREPATPAAVAAAGSELTGGAPASNPFAEPASAAPEEPSAAHFAKPLTAAEFSKATGSGIAVVDFWAEWCGPCQMQAPVFESFAKKYDGQIKFYKVDVDTEQQLGARFAANGIPALAFFRNGKLLTVRTGYHDEQALGEVLQQIKDNPLPLMYPYIMRPADQK